ncbi:MAG: chemotaxis protein CheD [Proteobacteria bacterium]|nr:chemotaxis protein CheD [Pseudomonadota bacterium]
MMLLSDHNSTMNSRRLPEDIAHLPRHSVRIGCVKISTAPAVFDTVLGSCISACLYDPKMRIGGMNHFMLPSSADLDNPVSTRYGVNAMELLINKLMKAGANRKNLVAKIFGGAHVLNIRESLQGVPQLNIQFIQQFLTTERIQITGQDIGGYQPRRILFSSHDGNVYMRLLGSTEAATTAKEEQTFLSDLSKTPDDGNSTLF